MRRLTISSLSFVALATVLAAPAQAADSTTTPTSTTTTTTATTTTATPVKPTTTLTPPTVSHKPKPIPPKPAKKTEYDVHNDAACPGGGTRSNDGTYDVTSGVVSFVTTVTGCVDNNKTTHDGTITITGSALAGSTDGTFALDLTYVFDTHYVNDNADVQRQCTWHKVGAFDLGSEKFVGTITKSDCVLTVTEVQKGNILEHILRKASASE